jgi:hypothetical protein
MEKEKEKKKERKTEKDKKKGAAQHPSLGCVVTLP